MRRLIWLAALSLGSASPAAVAAGRVKPLFAEDAPIEVTISGPIREIVRTAARSTDPHPATLEARGETLPIELSARGISRRTESCEFPPLRVAFAPKPADGSLFEGQHKLKLVDHCRDTNQFEQLTLREYVAYRLYQILTPESFKVRLARVTYVDGDRQVTQRWGFFVEDIDDTSKRMGGKEISVPSLPSTALLPEAAARVALFQYLIGNADWAMIAGPKGRDCCHNSKLVGATEEARTSITPVPYDFDITGLVDPPYAAPAPQMRISSVRSRRYWGFCRDSDELLRRVPSFIAARPAMEAEIAGTPGLDDRSRKDLVAYLGGFFEDVATPERIEKKLLRDCRN